ncbi:MAG TPA: glycosyltransferase family 39 protein [Solirubrobacterales bacterium]|nr:glycosyltransferase family 39 protein [Solirubrobacterales bacterium]
MEAAEALGRSGPSNPAAAIRDATRARSRAFWIVAGLTLLAAGLRFATLGVQAYHHDEIVTASRVLRGDFWHAMDAVGFSESAPPLYYAIAWLWTQVTGTGEWGLRSLSAFAGIATVPVAYLLGAELRGRRAGIAAAALVAVNPMLLWYSQEARGYALFVLLTTIAALYFVRALDGGCRRDFIAWGVASGLALATHYFAVFPIAAEAAWLLYRRRREALRGLAIVAGFGLLLAPLAIHQMSYGHAEWIGNHSLGHRLWETGVTFTIGETGDIISRPERPLLGLAPVALILAALGLLALRGDGRERRGAGLMLAIGAVTVAIPLAIGLLASDKDYVLARNLLPALVPLLAAVGIAVTLRSARRLGAVLGAALVAYSLGFSIWASAAPSLQRPDWDAVAAKIGEPNAPRAMVTWTLGEASLRYYLSTGSFQVLPSDGYKWLVGEVDFISDGPAPPLAARRLLPGFRQVGYERAGRLYIRSYETPGPGLAPLLLRRVREAQLNFRTNGALLDGIGPQ